MKKKSGKWMGQGRKEQQKVISELKPKRKDSEFPL